MDNDKIGKSKWKKHLIDYGYSEVIETDQYDNYDLVGVISAQTFGYEIKYRPNYNSNAFQDMMCEAIKYDTAIADISDNKLNKCYLVTIWNDDIAWVSDITKYNKRCSKMLRHTTDFVDNKLVDKDCLYYYPQYKIKL